MHVCEVTTMLNAVCDRPVQQCTLVHDLADVQYGTLYTYTHIYTVRNIHLYVVCDIVIATITAAPYIHARNIIL